MKPKYPNLKVVIVDDSPTCLKKNQFSVEQSGLFNPFNIFGFDHPLKAYTHINEHKDDILLSDYCLPTMMGGAFCRKIKEIHPSIKIILFSTSHVKELHSDIEELEEIVDIFIEDKKMDFDIVPYLKKLCKQL